MNFKAFRKISKTANLALEQDPFVMYWSYTGNLSENWGDKLNPYLAQALTGVKPTHRSEIYPAFNVPVHYWIGSHLASSCSKKNSVIWGGGFISSNKTFNFIAKEIHAVRGYLSMERLKHAGINVNDLAVGDPALLMSRVYQPTNLEKTFDLGIIPHINDRDEPFIREASKWPNTKIIDIAGSIEGVVDQILSCKYIASSSLHGIICADSYGVPSLWIEISKNLLGDGFKFLDYFSSVNRSEQRPFEPSAKTKMPDILDQFHTYNIDIDLEKLLASCPVQRVARE